MYKFDLIHEWKCFCVQEISELPNFKGAKKIYLDFETTSLDSKIASTNPHKDCELLGIAITVDDCQEAYYIPLQHEYANGKYCNLPEEPVLNWLREILENADEWINHNIKYDAHVLKNSGGIDVLKMNLKLCDTLTRIKIVHSDKLSYTLTRVMSEFLFLDVSDYENELKLALGRGNKDYGLVPIDIIAPYACVDALSVRKLNNYCLKYLHSDCTTVWEMETEFTPLLLDMEQTGMTVDIGKVLTDLNILPVRMNVLLQKLPISGKFKPHVSTHVEKLLCGQYGLPIIEWTDKGKPSFGKGVFEVYKSYPGAPVELLDTLMEYRELWKLYTSFTRPYAEFITKGSLIHCDYNQIVRTGRMSCRTPNMQQLSPAAKEYIISSDKGRVLVDIDFSQIEFRLIAHYIGATRCIDSYNSNPDQDFHQWVADMCGIPRKPAKNINFAIGYGAGKKKVLTMLSAIPEIVGELRGEEEREKRAITVYKNYYKALPTLKATRWAASQVSLRRGYVRTLMGRHRDIPTQLHFIAFNSVIQGSAADLLKSAALRLYKYLEQFPDIKLTGVVHDSFVLDMPHEDLILVPRMQEIVNELPKGISLKVPIRSDSKHSKQNWKEAV